MVDYARLKELRESAFKVGYRVGGTDNVCRRDIRIFNGKGIGSFYVGFDIGVAVSYIEDTLCDGEIVNDRDWDFVSALDDLKGLRSKDFWNIPKEGKVLFEGEISKYEGMLGEYFKKCATYVGSGV